MQPTINPHLQAYLLTAFLLVLLVVVWQPHTPYAVSLMVAGAVLAYVLLATAAQAGRVTCRLVSVDAGDTLTLLHKGRKVKVKLYGITAPERTHPLFETSRNALDGLLAGRELAFSSPTKTDKRAGRIRRDDRLMLFSDGWDVAPLLLAAGLATLNDAVDAAALPTAYRNAHRTAQDAAIGIHAESGQ